MLQVTYDIIVLGIVIVRGVSSLEDTCPGRSLTKVKEFIDLEITRKLDVILNSVA